MARAGAGTKCWLMDQSRAARISRLTHASNISMNPHSYYWTVTFLSSSEEKLSNFSLYNVTLLFSAFLEGKLDVFCFSFSSWWSYLWIWRHSFWHFVKQTTNRLFERMICGRSRLMLDLWGRCGYWYKDVKIINIEENIRTFFALINQMWL